MSDKIEGFIKSLLKISNRTFLDSNEKKLLRKEGPLGIIYQRLTSTKFRKSGVDEDTGKLVKNYLQRTVGKNEPIRMYFLFGGYKQARLPSAPYPEWAEVFTVNFALEAASYVESIYEKGVDVIYRGDEVIMTYLGNYKVEDRNRYTKRFNQIINLFEGKIPKDRKITIRYELTRETSPERRLISLMEKLYPKYLKKFEELNEDERKQRVWKSYRNHQWDGYKNITKLSEKEKQERAKWAYIMHDAFLEADVTLAKDYFDNGISVTYRRGVPYCLHYGATSSSSVQFWAGEGYLIKRDEKLIPWIYSYDQMQGLRWVEKEVKMREFNNLGLSRIRVIEEKN